MPNLKSLYRQSSSKDTLIFRKVCKCKKNEDCPIVHTLLKVCSSRYNQLLNSRICETNISKPQKIFLHSNFKKKWH